MSEKDDGLKTIEPEEFSKNIELYYDDFEKRLQSLDLEDIDSIRRAEGLKILRDKVCEVSAITNILNTVVNLQEKVDDQVRIRKMGILLERYIQGGMKQEERVAKVMGLLLDPYGFALISKFKKLSHENVTDDEFFQRLVTLFEKVAESDFVSLFDQHKFALDLVERLSPQALAVIADHKNWPQLRTTKLDSEQGRVVSDFSPMFAKSYSKIKQFDKIRRERLGHVLLMLQRERFIEARVVAEDMVKVNLTPIGQFLLAYMS